MLMYGKVTHKNLNNSSPHYFVNKGSLIEKVTIICYNFYNQQDKVSKLGTAKEKIEFIIALREEGMK